MSFLKFYDNVSALNLCFEDSPLRVIWTAFFNFFCSDCFEEHSLKFLSLICFELLSILHLLNVVKLELLCFTLQVINLNIFNIFTVKKKSIGLKSESIAGIIIGVVVFFILLVSSVVLLYRKWRDRNEVGTYFFVLIIQILLFLGFL